MKKLFQISLLFWLAASAAAQEQLSQKILQTFDWKSVSAQIPNSQIVLMDGMSVLKIENTNDKPLEISLLQITNSLAIEKASSVLCDMKYENVRDAFIQKTNYFSPVMRDTYVITVSAGLTLLTYLPPSALGGDETTNNARYYFNGTSNWKPYEFTIDRGMPASLPTRLEFKLTMPTNGIVYLRPVKLLTYVNGSGSWWSPQQSDLMGGIGGSIIGCFGGLIGWLVSKGKARKFVLTTAATAIVLGILLIITGLVAAILKQPYSVWYALLFPGVILVLVFSLNLHSIQRRYDELEIRRITSIDAQGS